MEIPKKWPHEIVVEEMKLDSATYPKAITDKLKGFNLTAGRMKKITDEDKRDVQLAKMAESSSIIAGMMLAHYQVPDEVKSEVEKTEEAIDDSLKETLEEETLARPEEPETAQVVEETTSTSPSDPMPKPPAEQVEEKPREATKAEIEAHILNSGFVKESPAGHYHISNTDLLNIGVNLNPRQSHVFETKKFRYDGLMDLWEITNKSKGIGVLGWLGIGAGVVIAGILGKKAYDNYQAKK